MVLFENGGVSTRLRTWCGYHITFRFFVVVLLPFFFLLMFALVRSHMNS